MKRVLSLGAGVQSTTLLLMSLRGELPRLDAAVFADTQWEPQKVYVHLQWLKGLCERAGLPLYTGTAGNLRRDAIDFRRNRRTEKGVENPTGRTRYASIPLFVKNLDGSQGRVKRQCTKEYKIEIVERIIRRLILGLKPRQRAPKVAAVEHWYGITTDESQRAVYPGRWETKQVAVQSNLFLSDGTPLKRKLWRPKLWQINCYPFLDAAMYCNRKSKPLGWLPKTMTQTDCLGWLQSNYPDHPVPRSACIGCPFHSNDEWRRMRDEEPEEWDDAVAFDHAQRLADHDGPGRRGLLVGTPYVHRQLVPLDMADLGGDGEKAGVGCGFLGDGFDGMCGV